MLYRSLKNAGITLLAVRAAAAQGLQRKLFAGWHPELDDALRMLPASDIFPHELFRSLMTMADPKRRQIVLLTERGTPVAVAGLRERWGYWEPVTQWIVPGVLFPVKEGYLPRVLAALGVEVRVGWWRWETEPPQAACLHDVRWTPTYGLRCSDDFESYWKERGQFKDVRKYRNRCKDLRLAVNAPGSTEWTIRNWEAKWRAGVPEMPDLAERLHAASYLEAMGAYYTLSVRDGEEVAAAGTFIIHRNDMVAHCNYRNPAYDWHGAMNRLVDLAFWWGREMGFGKVDLGGSFGYKERWAPEDGKKWEFTVCPGHVLLKERVLRYGRLAADAVNRNLRRMRLSPDRS